MVAPAAPRSWRASFRLHAERAILAKLVCTLLGRGPCRSQPKQYAHGPNGKVPASRRAAASLRPALPAPLPKSASDWMHARGRLPQRSGTNAPTPPMIKSPRLPKSGLVVPSRTARWTCGWSPTRGVDRSERVGSALVWVQSARRGVQASSSIDCRRKGGAVSGRQGRQVQARRSRPAARP
jgi:hypothetical protein